MCMFRYKKDDVAPVLSFDCSILQVDIYTALSLAPLIVALVAVCRFISLILLASIVSAS
jgi:hypothetical protein